MKQVVLALFVLAFSAPVFAGALQWQKLNEDSSAILNYGMFDLCSGESGDGSGKSVLVRQSPRPDSPFNHFCRWESIYTVLTSGKDGPVGYKFPPLCRIEHQACYDWSSRGGMPVYIVHEGELIGLHFTLEGRSFTEGYISKTDEDPPVREPVATKIDSFSTNLILNPPERMALFKPGVAEMKLFVLPTDSRHPSGKRNHLPIIAIREIVAPFRHAAYLLDAPYPFFSTYYSITAPSITHPDRPFLFELERSGLVENQTGPCDLISEESILVRVDYESIHAEPVNDERISALVDKYIRNGSK